MFGISSRVSVFVPLVYVEDSEEDKGMYCAKVYVFKSCCVLSHFCIVILCGHTNPKPFLQSIQKPKKPRRLLLVYQSHKSLYAYLTGIPPVPRHTDSTATNTLSFKPSLLSQSLHISASGKPSLLYATLYGEYLFKVCEICVYCKVFCFRVWLVIVFFCGIIFQMENRT